MCFPPGATRATPGTTLSPSLASRTSIWQSWLSLLREGPGEVLRHVLHDHHPGRIGGQHLEDVLHRPGPARRGSDRQDLVAGLKADLLRRLVARGVRRGAASPARTLADAAALIALTVPWLCPASSRPCRACRSPRRRPAPRALMAISLFLGVSELTTTTGRG